jgi:hypothetical protein
MKRPATHEGAGCKYKGAAYCGIRNLAVSWTRRLPAFGTFFAWSSFVDFQRAALHVGVVHPGDCRGGVFLVGHFHKTKTFGSAGVAVRNNGCSPDFTESGEGRFEVA